MATTLPQNAVKGYGVPYIETALTALRAAMQLAKLRRRSAYRSRSSCPHRAAHALCRERRHPSQRRLSLALSWRLRGSLKAAPPCGGGGHRSARPRRREGDGSMASSARVSERRSAGAMSPPLFSLPEARHRFTISTREALHHKTLKPVLNAFNQIPGSENEKKCTLDQAFRVIVEEEIVSSTAYQLIENKLASPGSQGLEGTPRNHPVQPQLKQVPYRIHRKASRWGFNTSRDGGSTGSLGSLFQCSVTLKVRKFLLMFTWNFLCCSLCPLPLILWLGTTKKSLIPSP
uniref:Uncharacterized protein n=1 Tax=Coturnix japonica TaxID=93934 RepID=A0A8C2TCB7_COTJA